MCDVPSIYIIIIIECRPSCAANVSSASQEILRILWNPRVQYDIYKSLPPLYPYPELDQSIPRIPHNIYLRSILLISSNLSIIPSLLKIFQIN